MSITLAELDRRFDYHAPDEITRRNHELVRSIVKDAATQLLEVTGESREQSLMLTALEECQAWAHADIARNHRG